MKQPPAGAVDDRETGTWQNHETRPHRCAWPGRGPCPRPSRGALRRRPMAACRTGRWPSPAQLGTCRSWSCRTKPAAGT